LPNHRGCPGIPIIRARARSLQALSQSAHSAHLTAKLKFYKHQRCCRIASSPIVYAS
jgi:hypothetical protein